MSQINFSALTFYLQLLIVLSVLNLCINNAHGSTNGIKAPVAIDNDQFFHMEDAPTEGMKLTRRGVWSRLFRSEINLPQRTDGHSYQAPHISEIGLKSGRIRLLPYDKRTIPIELRKALYAHGIVGRRR